MNIENSAETQKHSGLGISSFSIIMIVSIFITLLYFIYRYIFPENTYLFMILIYALYASPLISLVAIGLGIGGLIQKNQKKIFAILGTIFSVMVLMLSCVALLVWMSWMIEMQ
jgi:hypothetical protein